MIVATVTTCPRRWEHYQRMRRNFESLELPFPLRTFQTEECLNNPRLNANLNARAAMKYACEKLGKDDAGWLLYMEDDITIRPELKSLLPLLVELGARDGVDCWYLCGRENPGLRDYEATGCRFRELGWPILGTHAVLLAGRHVKGLLRVSWRQYADEVVFGEIKRSGGTIVQLVEPALVEHIGTISTLGPGN
jgi:hypothetical protein